MTRCPASIPNDVLRVVLCKVPFKFSESEAWKFINIGPDTSHKLTQMRVDKGTNKEQAVEI